jgi:hypothetical protein
MTDKHTPPDWVLIEAAKRSGMEGDVASLRRYYDYHSPAVNNSFVALCDMIERHEQPPVDRKLLCARRAAKEYGYDPGDLADDACRLAIELWIEGYGE